MSAFDALRAEVATQHGLGPEAASLLAGETLQELEESATALASFVDAHEGEAEPAAQVDPITAALAAQAAKKRGLAAALVAPRQQPRDEKGRYAASFDGGARSPVPEPSDPVRDHDEMVGELARVSRTFGVNL